MTSNKFEDMHKNIWKNERNENTKEKKILRCKKKVAVNVEFVKKHMI